MKHFLREWREARGLSQEQLGEAAGTDKTTVSKIERETRRMTVDWLSRFAKALNIQPAELLKPPPPDVHLGNSSDHPPEIARLPGYVEIEPVSVPAGLGASGEPVDYEIASPVWFREQLIVHELRAKPGDIKFLALRGQSMSPLLEHGDEVLVDTRDQDVSQAGIFVLYDGDGLVCKWVERVHGADPPRLRLISENKRFSPYEPLAETCNIIGRVVWFARRM